MSEQSITRTYILFLLFVILIPGQLKGQVSLGLNVGINQSWMQFQDPAGHSGKGNKPLTRFNAELQVVVPLVERLYLVPGVRYITKGTNLTAGVDGEYTRRLEVRYLEIPLNLTYKVPVSFGWLTIGAGPYAAYGLNGNNRMQVYNAGNIVSTTNYEVGFSSNPNKGIYPGTRLNRWDVGAQATVGIEFNSLLTLGLHYSRGIRNLDLSGNSIIRTNSVGVSLGVLLSREDY
ncbi:porin family protein [Chitinophaga sancti]|uniref:Outer membrane protein beta-barrel domain-containing protein n=1 Tax=Chitinophaga sancti TaxID=1004 RepID=A0A1K1SU79_9BACT|nr:porin family protein [Chitinophaga sancti]WQD60565.1 porin family protein [Chitinophaga sancti]WQG87307.1 porin family protein [Chitinophaga sancti]SFW87867.1 Outer membrane protein beta-barrel domain-containing protein [Chitinophaga sancti]